MKKNIIVAVAMALSLTATAGTKGIATHNNAKIGTIGSHNNSVAVMAPGDANSAKTMGMHKAPQAQASLTATAFGFLEGPDGKTWTFTQANEGTMYGYTSCVITVYDADNKAVGGFTVEIPAEMKVNQVEPFGLVTSKFFDKDASSKEVLVYLHQVGNADNNYKATDRLWAYSLDGTKKGDFLGDGMIVDASPNEWTTYQRMLVVKDDAEGKNSEISVYRNPSWGEDAVVEEHKFVIDNLLTTYTDGPFVNFVNLGGKPYYVLAHYEKPFVEYDEDGNQIMDMETFVPYFTENNSFILEVYDKNYDLQANVKMPCTKLSDDYVTRLMSFGIFSDNDMSRGKFSGDDKLNFIIMNEDVDRQLEYVTSFDVYDQDGKKINTIAEGVGEYFDKMSDIKGKDEQWIFLKSDGSGLFTVDLPSCTRSEMPSMIGEYSISTNIDRVPCNNAEGYKYIMGINEAKTDETQTNVIASFAYLNPDFSVEKYVDINLGALAQTFTPLVNNQGLDPYLFNTDDQREFLFFSKVKNSSDTESTGGHNVLFVANESGEIVESFGLNLDANRGDIWTASILNYGTTKPSLFVNYYNNMTDVNTMEYFSLPMTKFAGGGDGTEANPYIINSVGDMRLIANAPAAHYRLGSDINAYGFPVAIENFEGSLDGDGHVINNLDVTSDNYYGGLFGTATGATISNIALYAPVAEATAANLNLGILCGNTIETTIENITVNEANVTAEGHGTTPVGGLVGMLSAASSIKDSYIANSDITSAGNTVGAIAGEMRTGSTINACAIDATTVTGNREVGGIVGIIGTDCAVNDGSIRQAVVNGNSFVGGVAGRCGVNGNRGSIRRCVVNATVTAETAAIGGIAGCMEPKWTSEDNGAEISGNLLVETAIINGTITETCHRIAGQTIEYESKDDPKGQRTEKKITNNYVIFTATDAPQGAYQCTSNDANSLEGKDITYAELQTADLLTSLGYVFGTDTTAPWVFTSGEAPRLFFQEEGNLPSHIEGINVDENDNDDVNDNHYIFNIAGQRIDTPHRGIYIINGKKVIIK